MNDAQYFLGLDGKSWFAIICAIIAVGAILFIAGRKQ